MISIITPNFNYAGFITETVNSVIKQDYQDFEHIIVDDGSTDNSTDVIKDLLGKYPGKIKLIQQRNHGQTHAINVGLKEAKGDIIGWINSDDYYCENIFLEIISVFEDNPKVEAVFGNVNVVDIDGKFVFMKRHFRFNSTESAFIGFGNTLTSNCIFWRKSLSDRVGLFNEKLKCNMDGEFFSRLTCRANLYFLDKPIANFRKQQISISGKNDTNWSKIVKQEILYEKILSYKRLKISKVLPYSIGKQFGLFYLLKRVTKKIARLDYYRIYVEKKTYKSNHIKQLR